MDKGLDRIVQALDKGNAAIRAALGKLQKAFNEIIDKETVPPFSPTDPAYLLFAETKRAELDARYPGLPIAIRGMVQGMFFSALTPDERAAWQAKAEPEKERLNNERRDVEKYLNTP